MKRLIGAATALAVMLPGAAPAQDTIKVGILVALEGAFAAGGADVRAPIFREIGEFLAACRHDVDSAGHGGVAKP